ncbi:unnamed protein product [Sphagnum jensenii]|jgi:hypothetical protein
MNASAGGLKSAMMSFFRLSKSRSVFTTGEEEAVVVEDKQVHEKDDEVDMIVAGRRDVGNVELCRRRY